MNLVENPPGCAAVPDGRGGLRFVSGADVPPGLPWGHYRFAKEGAVAFARGPRPESGAAPFDWIPDDDGKPRVVGAPPAPPRPAPLPEPRTFAERLARFDAERALRDRAKAALLGPPRRRLPPSQEQLQAGDGGISTLHSDTGGSGPPAEASWAASRERVFSKTNNSAEVLDLVQARAHRQRGGF